MDRVLFSLERGGGFRFCALGFAFLSHLVLSLHVILGQVAVLAHAVGVVRLVEVAASPGHFLFASPVVAVVAHALGVVLLVGVRTHRDLSSLPLDSLLAVLFFFLILA